MDSRQSQVLHCRAGRGSRVIANDNRDDQRESIIMRRNGNDDDADHYEHECARIMRLTREENEKETQEYYEHCMNC